MFVFFLCYITTSSFTCKKCCYSHVIHNFLPQLLYLLFSPPECYLKNFMTYFLNYFPFLLMRWREYRQQTANRLLDSYLFLYSSSLIYYLKNYELNSACGISASNNIQREFYVSGGFPYKRLKLDSRKNLSSKSGEAAQGGCGVTTS